MGCPAPRAGRLPGPAGGRSGSRMPRGALQRGGASRGPPTRPARRSQNTARAAHARMRRRGLPSPAAAWRAHPPARAPRRLCSTWRWRAAAAAARWSACSPKCRVSPGCSVLRGGAPCTRAATPCGRPARRMGLGSGETAAGRARSSSGSACAPLPPQGAARAAPRYTRTQQSHPAPAPLARRRVVRREPREAARRGEGRRDARGGAGGGQEDGQEGGARKVRAPRAQAAMHRPLAAARRRRALQPRQPELRYARLAAQCMVTR